MRSRLLIAVAVAIVAVAAMAPVVGAARGDKVRVIVAFSEDVGAPAALANQLGRRHGFSVRHVYESALSGFAATVPARAVAALASSPRVAAVEVDTLESLADQTVPSGINRIEVGRRGQGA